MGTLAFPTTAHEAAAASVVAHFERESKVDAVLVIASCARGMAEPTSDLDMVTLVGANDRSRIEAEWFAARNTIDEIRHLDSLDRFTTLHLDVIDGVYEPVIWDGEGPDDFEVEIGNHVAYSAPIYENGDAFSRLQAKWLPYYDDALQGDRFAMVRDACLWDLEYARTCVGRGLHFQAFDRTYKAFREYLQALFISRRTYPIAYNKWIRHQICDLLGERGLYSELPSILEVRNLEGLGLLDNVNRLSELAQALDI